MKHPPQPAAFSGRLRAAVPVVVLEIR